MITISPETKEYWNSLLSENGKKYISLSIRGSGCAGFAYTWNYTDSTSDGVLVDDLVVVENRAFRAVNGSTIDYVHAGLGTEIKIINPNEEMSCGCGESVNFNIKNSLYFNLSLIHI